MHGGKQNGRRPQSPSVLMIVSHQMIRRDRGVGITRYIDARHSCARPPGYYDCVLWYLGYLRFCLCVHHVWPNTTKRYILSTFDKVEMFAFSNRRFNKLSKFINLSDTFENTNLNFLFKKKKKFRHCFAHYLRINLADKMSLLL